jgi:hypothetical protein
MKRFYAAVLLALASLLTTGCSPEDAKAAKVAASALNLQIDKALRAFRDLIYRAGKLPEETPEEKMKRVIATYQKRAAADPQWAPEGDRIQAFLAPSDMAARLNRRFADETSDITKATADIEAAAADYEAAWPFGSSEFVCLKAGVFRLTKSLRETAVSFDPGGSRYKALSVERDLVLARFKGAIDKDVAAKTGGTDSAIALQAFRDLHAAEIKANADVQAEFVRAAQSASELYSAIEAVESVSLTEVLRLVQRYAPGLTKLDESIDGEAIARRAGVILGELGKSKWLDKFANAPIPNVGPKCKQTQ